MLIRAMRAIIRFSMSEFSSYRPDLPGTEPAFLRDTAVAAPLSPRMSPWRVLREAAETLVLAALIFLAVRVVIQNFRVEGQSMEPNLDSGQYLLVNKALYTHLRLPAIDRWLPFQGSGDDRRGNHHLFRSPGRGDIVVFRFPQQPERDFIKRIIAVPGDTVELQDGLVVLNGEPLQEPYIRQQAHYSFGPAVVPPGQYFVLGDNRPLSYDSRVWGFLPEENIVGKAWISYWPMSAWGLIPNHPAAAKGTAGE